MTAVAPNLLIAENDDVSRLFLTDNLEADGYRPFGAAVTAAALELMSARLDALVVDVNGDTLDVIDAIRGELRSDIDPDLPILVLTSHPGELHRTRLLERGADDVLCKPYSYPELRARLGALLPRGRPPRAARRACCVPGRCGSMSGPAAPGSARSRSNRCAARSTSCCSR